MCTVLKFTITSPVLLFWTDRNFCFTGRLHSHCKLLSTPGSMTELRRHFDVDLILEFKITYYFNPKEPVHTKLRMK